GGGAVGRRRAIEPALVAELTRLREAQEFCAGTIKSVDDQARLPVGEGVAVRRVSRAIQQWQVDRIRTTPATKKRGLPLPWWSYPTAAAAAIIIGFLIWSSRQPIPSIDKADVAVNSVEQTPDEQRGDDGPSKTLADWMDSSFGV